MNNKIKCEICGKWFGSISPKHLILHGITTKEYKVKGYETINEARRQRYKGIGNPCYRNGHWLSGNGYYYISHEGKGYLEHRAIMEENLNRKLLPSEHIHHINNIKTDNRIENLEILSSNEHAIMELNKSWSQNGSRRSYKPQIMMTCSYCNKKLIRPNRYKNFKFAHHFCNNICYGLWQRKSL